MGRHISTKTAKTQQKQHRLKFSGFALGALILLFSLLLVPECVFATGWVGKMKAPSSSGSGGGGTNPCVGSSAKNNIDCTGMSWGFYKYIGGEEKQGSDLWFTPGNHKKISGTCAFDPNDAIQCAKSVRSDQATCTGMGGFWHWGVNAAGLKATWADGAYYNDVPDSRENGRRYKKNGANFSYTTVTNGWGHRLTRPWPIWRFSDLGASENAKTGLNHVLYRGNNKMYKLTAERTTDTYVRRDYRESCRQSGESGCENDKSSLLNGVYSFCWNSSMAEHKLTVEHILTWGCGGTARDDTMQTEPVYPNAQHIANAVQYLDEKKYPPEKYGFKNWLEFDHWELVYPDGNTMPIKEKKETRYSVDMLDQDATVRIYYRLRNDTPFLLVRYHGGETDLAPEPLATRLEGGDVFIDKHEDVLNLGWQFSDWKAEETYPDPGNSWEITEDPSGKGKVHINAGTCGRADVYYSQQPQLTVRYIERTCDGDEQVVKTEVKALNPADENFNGVVRADKKEEEFNQQGLVFDSWEGYYNDTEETFELYDSGEVNLTQHTSATVNVYYRHETCPLTLTVHYVGEDCNGNEKELEEQPEVKTVVPGADGSSVASFDKKNFDGYEFDRWEGEYDNDESDAELEIVEVNNGKQGEVNLKHGSATVTVHYKKTDCPCDPSVGGCGSPIPPDPCVPGVDPECTSVPPTPSCDEWMPDSYRASSGSEGWTSVVVGAQNTSLSDGNHGDWHHNGSAVGTLLQGPVYAKPTDVVRWRYCYFPGAQTPADEDVEPNPGNVCTIGVHYMTFMNAFSWGNTFQVKTQNLDPTSENYEQTIPRSNGDDRVVEGTMPASTYSVQQRKQPPTTNDKPLYFDPGDTLIGRIQTASGTVTHSRITSESQWCSRGCASWETGPCGYSVSYRRGERETTPEEDQADVKVPYNFRNTTRAKIVDSASQRALYAGETATVEWGYTVGTRQNDETEGNYATQVDGGKAKLFAFLVGPDDVENYNTASPEDSNINFKAWNTQATSNDDGINPPNGPEADRGETGYKVMHDADGTREICDSVNYKGGRCGVLQEENGEDGKLNSLGDLAGASKSISAIYNVFDEAAGNYFCVAAGIWPFTVKSDTDMDPEGDQAWLISKPSCRKLAKKPSFQAWGAGIFSAKGISTLDSVKNNVRGNFNVTADQVLAWQPKDIDTSTVWRFGSWGELGVTALGATDHIASGAAMGYSNGGYHGESAWNSSSNVGTEYWDNDAGGWKGAKDDSYCLRSPLTFSNQNCGDGSAGSLDKDDSGYALYTVLEKEKDDLKDRFTDPNSPSYELHQPSEGGDSNEDLTIPGDTIDEGRKKTVVYKTAGDITITGDIKLGKLPDGQPIDYEKIADIPKVLIYANNIRIGCNVHEIDAILVAEGTVYTCNELDAEPTIISVPAEQVKETEDDNNLKERSRQLIINGSVIADKLILGRSFGNGPGRNSITPAELFNYDSSIYLWAYGRAEGIQSGSYVQTAIRELAPRY